MPPGRPGRGSAPYSFPANYPGVLGVGAVVASGQAASFSSENLSVQVAAPGVNVPAEGRNSGYWTGQRDEPGVRHHRGRRRADQVEIPAA